MRFRIFAFAAAATSICLVLQASAHALDPAYRADQSSVQAPQTRAGAKLPTLLEEYAPAPPPEQLPQPSEPAAEPAAEPIHDTNSPFVWDRVRAGFALPRLAIPLVSYWRAWYLNRPQLLQAMFERSRPYIYHVVDELNRRGMPTELALLPMVESGYNPSALSGAQAAGLWQFIPSTGKQYRLEQNPLYDARRDIVASTAAALDYLESLFQQFGDWQLALAAYNAGEGAVRGAVKRNRTNALPTSYKSLALPEETRNYIPKLEALKHIVADPASFALIGAPIPNRPYFATISSPYILDFNVAAALADLPLQEFRALNPANNILLMSKNAPTKIVVPVDKVASFMDRLEHLDQPPADEASARPEPPRRAKTHTRYVVRPGDTFASIAQKLGVSEGQLRIWNPRAKAAVRVGQKLRVRRAQ